MSWWETGDNGKLIGDEPADATRHTLLCVAEESERQGHPKPQVSELLLALSTVASRAPGHELESSSTVHEIVAELKSGEKIRVSSADAAQDWELAATLADNLSAVAAMYQSRWQRPPKLSEWLELFAFVLRFRPEEYLEDGERHAPVEIYAA